MNHIETMRSYGTKLKDRILQEVVSPSITPRVLQLPEALQLYFINLGFHTNLDLTVLYTQHMHHYTHVTSQLAYLTIRVPNNCSIEKKGV